MCGNIISGRTDQTKPFFTKGGSFWSNSTTELLASTIEEDRLARTRNRCNAEGYESVALIPLRSGKEIIGLLQFNDRRKGCFSLELIQFFEGIGQSIAIASRRKQMQEELNEKVQTLEMFNKFSVGREMEMVELKNQIAELKAQIEKAGQR